MQLDVWRFLTKREKAKHLRLAEKYPCEQCAHNPRRLGASKCRMGFLVEKDGEPGGCLSRDGWWKQREAPR